MWIKNEKNITKIVMLNFNFKPCEFLKDCSVLFWGLSFDEHGQVLCIFNFICTSHCNKIWPGICVAWNEFLIAGAKLALVMTIEASRVALQTAIFKCYKHGALSDCNLSQRCLQSVSLSPLLEYTYTPHHSCMRCCCCGAETESSLY